MGDFKSFGKSPGGALKVEVTNTEPGMETGKVVWDTENRENTAELGGVLAETRELAEELKVQIEDTDPQNLSWDKIRNAVKKYLTVEKILLGLGILTGSALIIKGGAEWTDKMAGTEAFAKANTAATIKIIGGTLAIFISWIAHGIATMKVPEKKKI